MLLAYTGTVTLCRSTKGRMSLIANNEERRATKCFFISIAFKPCYLTPTVSNVPVSQRPTSALKNRNPPLPEFQKGGYSYSSVSDPDPYIILLLGPGSLLLTQIYDFPIFFSKIKACSLPLYYKNMTRCRYIHN
jgi:hypothetical protein